MKKVLTPRWEYISDGVMGGVSKGKMSRQTIEGRDAHHLFGGVSLDNNGGFLQMAFDLNRDGAAYDASRWSGIEVDVLGNGQLYEVRLRTAALFKPWQSFRLEFQSSPSWTTMQMPFSAFTAHRHDLAFDPAQLCRIGVLAIGREFHADISVARVRFFN